MRQFFTRVRTSRLQVKAVDDSQIGEKKHRILRHASAIMTSALSGSELVSLAAVAGGPGRPGKASLGSPSAGSDALDDEWEAAERDWVLASAMAEDAIASAQAKLRGQQQSLSAAREALTAARKAATEENLGMEESFDPHLEDATQVARAKLQHIEATIRESLMEAQDARKTLSEASTRSRQTRRERDIRAGGAAIQVGGGAGGASSGGADGADTNQTTSEKCQVQLDQVQKQLEKISRDLGSNDGQWSIEDWLRSLRVPTPVQPGAGVNKAMSVLSAIANALEARRPPDQSAYEYAKSLEDVEGLLMGSDLTRIVAQVIEDGVKTLRAQKAATAQQLSDKFKNEEGAMTFSFGGLSTFFGGLEGLVGTPNAALREYMMLDHCGMLDSCEWFAVKNCGDVDFMGHKVEDRGKEWPATMSIIEWYYVVDPTPEGMKHVNTKLVDKDRKPLRNWPIEHDDIDHDAHREQKPMTSVRRKEPLATFMREAKLRKIDKQLVSLRTDQLREEEVISARLYTGPVSVVSRAAAAACQPASDSLSHTHGQNPCASADVCQVQLRAARGR